MSSNLSYDRFISNIDKLSVEDLKKILKDSYYEKNFFSKFLNQIDEGVIIIDKSYKLHYLNRKSKIIIRKTGYLESIRNEIPEILINEIDKVIEGKKKIKGIIYNFNFFKEKYLFEFNIYNLENGLDGFIAIIFYDINAKYLKEKEESLARSLASLVELTYTFAHEVRNPLTSIDLNLVLLGQELRYLIKDDQKCQNCKNVIDEKIEILRNEIKRINSIVDKFLNTTKPLKPNFQKVNINEIIKEIYNLVQNEFKINNKIISLLLKEDIEDLFLDPNLLKQVLLNLIKNALDAIISKKDGQVIVKTNSDENNIYIEVIDNGVGISKENIDKLFIPFFTTKPNGTGLGLTVVYRIINIMGGEIAVKSVLNKGTTFKITFSKNKFKNISIPFYDK